MDTSNIWCWLCPLLTGIISGIIGYYWGKSNSTLTNNCDDCIDKNKKLQLEIDKLKADLSTAKSIKTNAPAAQVTPPATASVASGFAAGATTTASLTTPSLKFNAEEAKAIMGKKIKADDLKLVEGIGPKIASLFHNHDIKTWYALSQASIETCQKVLDSGGKAYEIHNPESWPLQAGMAFNGEWQKLADWQDSHKGGRF